MGKGLDDDVDDDDVSHPAMFPTILGLKSIY